MVPPVAKEEEPPNTPSLSVVNVPPGLEKVSPVGVSKVPLIFPVGRTVIFPQIQKTAGVLKSIEVMWPYQGPSAVSKGKVPPFLAK